MEEKNVRQVVYEAIDEERDRQDRKWGPQREQSPLMWLAILTEEVGETAEEVLNLEERDPPSMSHLTYSALSKELLQVAAVAVCWLEALEEEENDQN